MMLWNSSKNQEFSGLNREKKKIWKYPGIRGIIATLNTQGGIQNGRIP